MLYENESYYTRYLTRVSVEDIYRGGESLFRLCRESDLTDISKVMGVQVEPLIGENEMRTKLYYGLEDAVRSLYRKGGRTYMTYWDMRIRNKDGTLFALHRVPPSLVDIVECISLEAFLTFPDGFSVHDTKSFYRPVVSL